MTIWKYQLEVADRQDVTMPDRAEILSVAMQAGIVCLWALIPDEKGRALPRSIKILGTGNPINGDPGKFIGSVQQGPLVWHIFDAGFRLVP